jgi:hypothetical protein
MSASKFLIDLLKVGATVGATVGEKLKIGTVGAALGPPAALKNHIKAIETHSRAAHTQN